jgi:spermidine synthase
VDSLTVQTVYATLSAAFPEVETWYTKQDDLILAATAEPIAYDAAKIRERVAQEPYASAMERAWRARGLEGFLSHYVARASLSRALAGRDVPRNTDDRNVVEFAFARSLGRDSYFDVNEMRRVARARHEDSPQITGDVDWLLVNRWRVSAATATAARPVLRPDLSVEELRMTMAQRSFLEGRPETVLTNWRAQPWQPVGSVEEVVLGEALAQGGDDQALVLAQRLQPSHPVEAEVLTARLRWRKGQAAQAVESLEKAFTLYRQNPWPMPILVKNAFAIVLDLAAKDPAAAARLDAALSQPFAISVLNEERNLVRLELASRLGVNRYASTVSEMEPDVPWRTPILQQRANAYEATGNSLRFRARKELTEFLEKEPPPFAPGVEPAPAAAPAPAPPPPSSGQ